MVNEDVSSNMIGSTSKSSGNTKTNKAKRKDNRKCLTDNIINYDIVRQIDLGNRSNHTTISLLTKLEEQNKQNQTDPNLNSNKLKKKQTVDEGIINIDEGIDENLAEFNHCPDIKFGSYNLCRNRNSQGDNIKLYSSSNNNKYDRISNFDAVKAKGTPLYTQRSNDSEVNPSNLI